MKEEKVIDYKSLFDGLKPGDVIYLCSTCFCRIDPDVVSGPENCPGCEENRQIEEWISRKIKERKK